MSIEHDVWINITSHPVPKDGKMYLVLSPDDCGVVWWSAEDKNYGWIAEGETLEPDNITHWTNFPERDA